MIILSNKPLDGLGKTRSMGNSYPVGTGALCRVTQ